MSDTNSIYKALVRTIAESAIQKDKPKADKAKALLKENILNEPAISKELEIVRSIEKLKPIKSETEAWFSVENLASVLLDINKRELLKAKTKLNSAFGAFVPLEPIGNVQMFVNELLDSKTRVQQTMAKRKLVSWLMESSDGSIELTENQFTNDELLSMPVFANKINSKYVDLLPEQKAILNAILTEKIEIQLARVRKSFEIAFSQNKDKLDDESIKFVNELTSHPAYNNYCGNDSVLLCMGLVELKEQLTIDDKKTINESVLTENDDHLVQRLLLVEGSPFEYDQKSVVEDSDGCITVSGILQRADTLNQNGRIYPFDILKREIENYKSLIKRRGAFGELDHRDDVTVQMKNVSHMIVDIDMNKEGVVTGKVKIFDTTTGKDLKAIIKGGGVPGISSRALGQIKMVNKAKVVQDDLVLICWDFVHEPSTPGAFMHLSKEKEVMVTESFLRRAFSSVRDEKTQAITFSLSAQVERIAKNIIFSLGDNS